MQPSCVYLGVPHSPMTWRTGLVPWGCLSGGIPTQVAVIPIATSRVLASLVPPLSNQHVFTLLPTRWMKHTLALKKSIMPPLKSSPSSLNTSGKLQEAERSAGLPALRPGAGAQQMLWEYLRNKGTRGKTEHGSTNKQQLCQHFGVCIFSE